jgi:ribosome biogenesis GTPase
MAYGIIFKALSGFYYVESEDGTVECRARGRFRLEKSVPLVGDHVEFTPTEPGRGVLTKIHPRKNAFIRPPIANIDKMVMIVSGAVPVTDPYLIDRMTVISQKNDCEAVICVNKCDLDPGDFLYDIYQKSGFITLRTSAETGEGREDLLSAISGSICAFTGNSGVGKSSILNMLEPDFKISTGEISKKLGRGRHTTRHVELFKLPGDAIIADTPGFSAFDTEHQLTSKDELQYMFPDFAPYLGACRFLDCAHIKEPGCAV